MKRTREKPLEDRSSKRQRLDKKESKPKKEAKKKGTKTKAEARIDRLPLSLTGAVAGTIITGCDPKKTGGASMRLISPAIIPPRKKHLDTVRENKEDWGRFLQQLGSLPWFADKTTKEREEWLAKHEDKGEVELAVLGVRVQVFSYGDKNNFTDAVDQEALAEYPPGCECTALQIRECVPLKPGSKARRSTLYWLSCFWTACASYRKERTFKGVTLVLVPGKAEVCAKGYEVKNDQETIFVVGDLGFVVPECEEEPSTKDSKTEDNENVDMQDAGDSKVTRPLRCATSPWTLSRVYALLDSMFPNVPDRAQAYGMWSRMTAAFYPSFLKSLLHKDIRYCAFDHLHIPASWFESTEPASLSSSSSSSSSSSTSPTSLSSSSSSSSSSPMSSLATANSTREETRFDGKESNQSFPIDFAVCLTAGHLLAHPGSFVENLGIFETGKSSFIKREGVIQVEDGFTRDANVLFELFGCAFLAQRVPTWNPTEKMVRGWFEALVYSLKTDVRSFEWSIAEGAKRKPFVLLPKPELAGSSQLALLAACAALLPMTGSFDGDVKMLTDVARRLEKAKGDWKQLARKAFDPKVTMRIRPKALDVFAAMDHHTFPNVAYFFPADTVVRLAQRATSSEFPYAPLFGEIWQVSGCNWRRVDPKKWPSVESFEKDPWTQTVRVAQRTAMDVLLRPRRVLGRESTETVWFEYTLPEALLSGLLGHQLGNNKRNLSMLLPDCKGIKSLRAPSRDTKSATDVQLDDETTNKQWEAVQEQFSISGPGVPLTKACKPPLDEWKQWVVCWSSQYQEFRLYPTSTDAPRWFRHPPDEKASKDKDAGDSKRSVSSKNMSDSDDDDDDNNNNERKTEAKDDSDVEMESEEEQEEPGSYGRKAGKTSKAKPTSKAKKPSGKKDAKQQKNRDESTGVSWTVFRQLRMPLRVGVLNDSDLQRVPLELAWQQSTSVPYDVVRGADVRFDQLLRETNLEYVRAAMCVLLRQPGEVVEMPQLSRNGNGTDMGVTAQDVGGFQLLARVSLLYPAAFVLDTKRATRFRVRVQPLAWSLRNRMEMFVRGSRGSPNTNEDKKNGFAEFKRRNDIEPFDKRKPKVYQERAVEQMVREHAGGKRAFLLDLEAGRGKTKIDLDLFARLGCKQHYFVLTCPASAMPTIVRHVKRAGHTPRILMPNKTIPYRFLPKARVRSNRHDDDDEDTASMMNDDEDGKDAKSTSPTTTKNAATKTRVVMTEEDPDATESDEDPDETESDEDGSTTDSKQAIGDSDQDENDEEQEDDDADLSEYVQHEPSLAREVSAREDGETSQDKKEHKPKTIELKSGVVYLVESTNNGLLRCAEALLPYAPNMFLVLDESHLMMRNSGRTRAAELLSANAALVILQTGTLVTRPDTTSLIRVLQQVTPYHVTDKNLWVAAAGRLSYVLEQEIEERLEVIQCTEWPSLAAQQAYETGAQRLKHPPPGEKPTTVHQLLTMCYEALDGRAIEEVRKSMIAAEKAFKDSDGKMDQRCITIVVKDVRDTNDKKSHATRIQERLLQAGIAKTAKEWFTIGRDGVLDLPYEPGKKPKYRFVFVPFDMVLGYDLTFSNTLVMFTFIGCNATQLICRLKRMGQPSSFVIVKILIMANTLCDAFLDRLHSIVSKQHVMKSLSR